MATALGDYILIEPEPAESTDLGGFIIEADKNTPVSVGAIISVGDAVVGKLAEAAPGTRVAYLKQAANPVSSVSATGNAVVVTAAGVLYLL